MAEQTYAPEAVIEIRVLTDEELPRVDAALPLDRLTGSIADAGYLIAWEDGSPIGHAYLAWAGTELGLPELQDVFVTPGRRGAEWAQRPLGRQSVWWPPKGMINSP